MGEIVALDDFANGRPSMRAALPSVHCRSASGVGLVGPAVNLAIHVAAAYLLRQADDKGRRVAGLFSMLGGDQRKRQPTTLKPA
jgi:hypothetical protein